VGSLSVSACTIQADDEEAEPECGNGSLEDGEECDGSDFGSNTCAVNGFDEGALGCTAECVVETTACYLLDGDFDLLTIDQEEAAGTDPNNPDTDLDGFLDGVEVQSGTDPLNMYSWPQNTGSWPNRLVSAQTEIVAEGWQPGQVIPDKLMVDQFGNTINLHQFYGYKIVVAASAVWCPPCNEAAKTAQALWSEHREDGVIFIENLVDGPEYGTNATDQDLQNWTNAYQLQFPVVRSDTPFFAFSLPTFFYINSDMTLASKEEGFGGDAAIASKIATLH